MIKNNAELRGTLDMLVARLNGDPKSSEEWKAIVDALHNSLKYAQKTCQLRTRLEASEKKS